MTTHSMIHKALQYIESHLEEELRLEQIAAAAGFSMYHFHRLFQEQIGMTTADYIRCRRLALGAAMLMHTNEEVLHIALQCRFQSQEAFTRAFKKLYHLPPGRYRKLMASVMQKRDDKGECENMERQEVKGWLLSGSDPSRYEMGTDRKQVHTGQVSGYLKSVTASTAEQFATMMQQFRADKCRGERVRLSAFIRTEDVKYFAGLWMRIDNASGDTLQFDNMSDRPIVGSHTWNQYSCVLDVPEDSATISFGVLLTGSGKVWMDGFAFEKVDRRVASTNMGMSTPLLDEPTNLNFEATV
ncbi:AraC family transcriptional regulator [Paenibacillus sp. J5C_2022]|uniref:helix-turn-helix domain-containing protein n=1 Tax=Paenibacillus sp. J5C2022 TaxID=2977129 RepID=UPI0021D08A8F|nr:AraC family transcriptional regulator [Paenibacillus sp. J5C2022]MCU6707740.1 AraC family transcriptional regulator [Paenibacillus sp. J5C2022]